MNGQPGKLLRIFLNAYDRYEGRALHEAIVDRCRQMRVAGVTVFSGLEGFGDTGEIRHRGTLSSRHEPVVITIVERPDRAEQILRELETLTSRGIVAVSDVEVITITNRARTTLPL